MELSEQDRAQLSLLAKLRDGEPLPERLVEEFGRVRRLASRLGIIVLSAEMMVLAGLRAGLGFEEAEKPDGVEEWIQSGELVAGKTIRVNFRNSEREGTYLGQRSDGRVKILFPDRQQEQTVDPKFVLGVVETAEA